MSAAKLDDENVHVRELNKLFLGCTRNGETFLDAAGLRTLCEKLNLISFSDEIIARVLCGFRVVEFPEFKDRFVQLLPEIIEVNTTNECIENNAVNNLSKLGIKSKNRLSRQELQLLCECTPELSRLSSADVSNLFDRLDTTGCGHITLNQFLREFHKQKRLSQEINFISETFIPSVNLFEAIDLTSSGTVDCQDLLGHWATCGISTEQGVMVLKQTGLYVEGKVDAIALSGKLERQLGDLASGPAASMVVRVALVSLHSFIDHLRCMVKEGGSRAEHLYKQLQMANQRRNMLIEELEQNQMATEQGYEMRLKESEERYKTKIGQIEDRCYAEKKDLTRQLEQVEEELSRVRQTEGASRNRLQLLERQCTRLREESSEMADTIPQLEQLNRQLRQELSKMMQPRTSDDSNSTVMWRHRVELLLTHNKRLRDKIDELTKSQQKKKPQSVASVEPLCTHWTNAFRSQLMAIRKRRLTRANDTLSEMESEPEAIFVRARKRRLLNVRERKRRYDKVWKQILNREILSGSSDAEMARNGSFQKSLDVQKLQALVEKAKLEEVKKLKEENQNEMSALKTSANLAMAEALSTQEKQLNEKFNEERKQFHIKMENDRNELERKFAKEKVKLINRLQEEFDQELNRLRLSASSSVTSSDARKYERQIESLETSLQDQRDVYERKMTELKEQYAGQLSTFRSAVCSADSSNSSFCSLMDKVGADLATLVPCGSTGTVGVNSTEPGLPLASSASKKAEWDLAKCSRCELIDRKLKQLHSTFICGENLTESGIEDLGSSADSSPEEKAQLKHENKKLKGRLDLLKEKIIDLRLALSLQNGQYKRYVGVMGGSECSDFRLSRDIRQPLFLSEGRGGGQCQYLAVLVNRLEADNVLLNARLTESRELVKCLAAKCKEQLDEIARLGTLFQQLLLFELPANCDQS